jgi:hypothetical protein
MTSNRFSPYRDRVETEACWGAWMRLTIIAEESRSPEDAEIVRLFRCREACRCIDILVKARPERCLCGGS